MSPKFRGMALIYGISENGGGGSLESGWGD